MAGFIGAKKAGEQHIAENRATVYKSQFHAQVRVCAYVCLAVTGNVRRASLGVLLALSILLLLTCFLRVVWPLMAHLSPFA